MWIGGVSVWYLHYLHPWPMGTIPQAYNALTNIMKKRESKYPWIGLDEVERRARERMYSQGPTTILTETWRQS